MPAGTAFRSVWTQVGGLPMHAKVSAEGVAPAARVPLVLVHGLGLSHRYMMPTAERLAPEFAVHVPDLSGFGDSGHPREILGIPGLADALLAWMDAAGLGCVSLLGNSQGCQVIADLAARIRGGWRDACSRGRPRRRRSAHGSGSSSAGGRTAATTRPISGRRPGRITGAPAISGRCGPSSSRCATIWRTSCRASRRLPEGRLVEIPAVAHTLVFTAPGQLATVTRQFLEEDAPGRA